MRKQSKSVLSPKYHTHHDLYKLYVTTTLRILALKQSHKVYFSMWSLRFIHLSLPVCYFKFLTVEFLPQTSQRDSGQYPDLNRLKTCNA